MKDHNYKIENNSFDESINLRDEIEKLLVHWKWFALSALVMMVLGFVYIRYTPPSFQITSTILIKEEQNALGSQLSAFQDLSMFGGGMNNIENEIQLLESKTLMASLISELGLNVSYYTDGIIKDFELYANRIPAKLKEVKPSTNLRKLDTTIGVALLDNGDLELSDAESNVMKTIKLGDVFSIKNQEFTFIANENYEPLDSLNLEPFEFKVCLAPTNRLIENLSKSIKIELVEQLSTVLKLSMSHSVKQKGQDILNTLVEKYNLNAIQDKSEVGNETSKFIKKRLEIIAGELSLIDKNVEAYKKLNELTDVKAESAEFLTNVSRSEKELFEITTQLRLVEFMSDYLKTIRGDFELIPANLGFEDKSLANLTVQYNELALERNRLLRNSSARNPLVRNLESQLLEFQENIKYSLVNLKASLQISFEELSKQDDILSSKISAIPTKEREFRKIERQQQIKEALYLYLLQKQEETDISLAVTEANAKVIDLAYVSYKPIAPRKKLVLVGSLFVGLLIPFGILYIMNLLDTKLHTRKDLEQSVSTPILGDIPINDAKDNIVVKEGGRSSTAEAFRLLRTNLDFMLTGVDDSCKSIFVTSTTSGEGKSFVSVNLACTLALSGKKVALLGMDLRAPKITEYLGVPNNKGVTNYIKDNSLDILDLRFHIEGYKNLDIYSSGIIPPNPAELLLNQRVEEMFTTLKEEYDYIVVDTAPVNLVTDTLLVSKYADMFIYVARAGYLDKRLLSIPQNLYADKRLPNMAMLINASDYKKSYGYGAYGAYGYGESEVLPWWKKILS